MADPPVIPPQRLDQFITDVFHNVAVLAKHHRQLLDVLQHKQLDDHSAIHSVTVAVLDAFLGFRDAYLKYISNYPIAVYRIEEERRNNLRFKEFYDVRFTISISPLT
jgi:hypothetical protein